VPTSVPKPSRSVPQISIADDIIAIEDATSLVAAQSHGHAFRNAGPDHVADGSSPEVVRNAAGTPGGRPGTPPRLVEATLGDALAGKVSERARLGDPMNHGLPLLVREALVVHPMHPIDQSDVACLGQERAGIDEAPQRQQLV
jgi:hypothetical protein